MFIETLHLKNICVWNISKSLHEKEYQILKKSYMYTKNE